MKKSILIVIFVLSSFVWAQTPKKISNNDLRSSKAKYFFHIKEMKKMKRFYLLEVNNGGEYNLKFFSEGKLLKNQKIARSDADRLDQLFADKFIALKYEMAPPPKKCQLSFELKMRDEVYSVCKLETKKIEILEQIMNDMKKIFS